MLRFPPVPKQQISECHPWREWFMGIGSTSVSIADLTAYYGSFYDTTTQTAGANTATVLAIGSTDLSNGVTIGAAPSKITFSYKGIYNCAFSLQLSNTDTSTDNVTVWFKKNGTDISNSASVIGTPGKHGTTPGATIAAANFFLSLTAGDYIQMYWATDLGTSSIKTLAAGVAPVHPVSPGVILTVNQVG